jgi:hypothetical protein
LYNNGSPNGAVAASTGLGIGDNGASAGNINDNNWHTLTMVVKDETGGRFSQSVYVNGSLLNSSSLQYGAVGALADASFSLGAIRDGSAEKFVGEVAALRFDDTPLATSDVATLHSTYLGVIPEPSTSMLIGFGAISLFATRHWQRHSKKSQIIHPLP